MQKILHLKNIDSFSLNIEQKVVNFFPAGQHSFVSSHCPIPFTLWVSSKAGGGGGSETKNKVNVKKEIQCLYTTLVGHFIPRFLKHSIANTCKVCTLFEEERSRFQVVFQT